MAGWINGIVNADSPDRHVVYSLPIIAGLTSSDVFRASWPYRGDSKTDTSFPRRLDLQALPLERALVAYQTIGIMPDFLIRLSWVMSWIPSTSAVAPIKRS